MGNSSFLQRAVLALTSLCLPGICALALAPAAQAADKPADVLAADDQLIAQARASYYSLKREGMAEFRCRVAPNFEAVIAELRKTNAAEADRRAKLFQRMRFDVTVPIEGNVSLTHSYDGEVPADLAANFDKINHGMDQAVRGFFMTWRGFMVTDMFPRPAVAYTLDKVQSGYRISYLDHGASALVTMDHDMVISSIKMTMGPFEGTISPHFEKIDGKLVLVSYEGVSQGPVPGAHVPDVKAKGHFKIDNQLVDGFLIPRHHEMQGTVNGETAAMGITFSDCHAKRTDAAAPLTQNQAGQKK